MTNSSWPEVTGVAAAAAFGAVMVRGWPEFAETSATAASWVQAVGSIVAILASVALVRWQDRIADGRRARAEGQSYRQRQVVAALRCRELVGATRSMEASVKSEAHSAHLHRIIPFLDSASAAVLSVDLTTLNVAHAKEFAEARMQAHQLPLLIQIAVDQLADSHRDEAGRQLVRTTFAGKIAGRRAKLEKVCLSLAEETAKI